ncbi:hypothetical protein MKW98_030328, partial [Papaver atlanticum]
IEQDIEGGEISSLRDQNLRENPKKAKIVQVLKSILDEQLQQCHKKQILSCSRWGFVVDCEISDCRVGLSCSCTNIAIVRSLLRQMRFVHAYRNSRCICSRGCKQFSVYFLLQPKVHLEPKYDVIEHPFVQWISEPQEGNWLVGLTLTWRISSALLERQK